MSALLLALVALAQDPDDKNRAAAVETKAVPEWSITTFSAPNTGLEVLCAMEVAGDNECLTLHLTGAAGAGAMFKQNGEPGWFGQVRVAGEFRYGLLSNGYGLEARVGSFWGVDRELFRVLVGPDVIGNLYQGFDYALEPGLGVGWTFYGALKPIQPLWIEASATPTTQLFGGRKLTNLSGISLLDELTYRVGLSYQELPNLTAGYTWRRNHGGIQHGFYLGGAF